MFKKVKNPLFLLFLIVIVTILTLLNISNLIKLYKYYTIWEFVGLAGVTFLILLAVYLSLFGSYLNIDSNIVKGEKK
jgi:hypothetical protein